MGKLAIKSLFDLYSSVEYLSYDDMSEGFWKHIGGGEYERLSRDSFFEYYKKSLTPKTQNYGSIYYQTF